MRASMVFVASLSLAGCAGVAGPASLEAPASRGPVESASPASSAIAVPLVTEDRGPGCFMMLIGRVRVEANPGAPQGEALWLAKRSGERVWPIWPDGFTAVMDPELRVIDAQGQTVITEGQWFDAGGSFDGDAGAYVCAVDERTYT